MRAITPAFRSPRPGTSTATASTTSSSGPRRPTARQRAALPATATWCSARRRASAAIDLAASPRHRRLRHLWRGRAAIIRLFGLLGRGHQRRRLRRPRHRGCGGRWHRQRAVLRGRQLCGVRQGAGFAPRSISPRSPPAPAASSSTARMRTMIRPLGLLGRRRQRRRLRRPDHRGPRRRCRRRHAQLCRRQLCDVRQGGWLCADDRSRRARGGAAASSSMARTRSTTQALRCPRPGTSTATASTT